MKKPKNRVITLILLLAFILWPCSTYNVEAAVITASGIILAAKIISWTATGLDAAKTTAEIVYQQLVSAESMRLYKQRLNDLDIDLDELKLKIIATGPKEVEKLRKLLLKREFILQEKIGLGTVVRAIEENRDAIVKKKFMKGIKSVIKGYVVGELVSITGGDMVGAVHTLQDTVSKMPADLKEAYLEKKISKEDREFHDTLGAQGALTRLRVAMLEAEFDKYISEVVKPAFQRYMTTGKDDLYSQLPPEIRKLVRGEYEAKTAERLREREKQLEEYRRMRLEALKKQQEDMRKRQEMAQKRLRILQNNPEVVKGFKKIVAKKPVGDDDKLAQYIASVALASEKIVAEGAKIPPKQKPEEEKKPEVISKEEPDLMLEEKLGKKEPDIETLGNSYIEKRKESFEKFIQVRRGFYQRDVIVHECLKIKDDDDKLEACLTRVRAQERIPVSIAQKLNKMWVEEIGPLEDKMKQQEDKLALLPELSVKSPPEKIDEYLNKYSSEIKQLEDEVSKLKQEVSQLPVRISKSIHRSGDTAGNRQLFEEEIQIRKKLDSMQAELFISEIKLEAIKELKKKIEELNKK